MSSENQQQIGTFQVSARKYRPQSFRDVLGQNHVVTTLRNAVCKNKIAHAYLFCGLRGVGKTSCARILAKAINCLNAQKHAGEPCDECEHCIGYEKQHFFNTIELDAASHNSVDNVREWVQEARVPPVKGRYKVYIIDEAHMLSTQAFNAFLKTLEEPPDHAIFILATTEKHKIIPTILSRCQVLDFTSVPMHVMIESLRGIVKKEKIQVTSDSLHVIAEKSDGSLRDALSLFDKLTAFAGDNITMKEVQLVLHLVDDAKLLEIIDCFLNQRLVDVLLLVDKLYREGHAVSRIFIGLAGCFRNLLVAKDTKTESLIASYQSLKLKYLDLCNRFDTSYLVSAVSIIQDALKHLPAMENKRYYLEHVCMKLTYLASAYVLVEDDASFQKKKLVNSIANKVKVNTCGLSQPSLVNVKTTALHGEGQKELQEEVVPQLRRDNELTKDPNDASQLDSQATEVPLLLDSLQSGGILSKIREKSRQKLYSKPKIFIDSQDKLDNMANTFQESFRAEPSISDMGRSALGKASYQLDDNGTICVVVKSKMEGVFFEQEVMRHFHSFLYQKTGVEDLKIRLDHQSNPKQKQTLASMDEMKQKITEQYPMIDQLVKQLGFRLLNFKG